MYKSQLPKDTTQFLINKLKLTNNLIILGLICEMHSIQMIVLYVNQSASKETFIKQVIKNLFPVFYL